MNYKNYKKTILVTLTTAVLILLGILAYGLYTYVTGFNISQEDNGVSGSVSVYNDGYYFSKISGDKLVISVNRKGVSSEIYSAEDISNAYNLVWSPDHGSFAITTIGSLDTAYLATEEPREKLLIVAKGKEINFDGYTPNNYIFSNNDNILAFYTPVELGSVPAYFLNINLTTNPVVPKRIIEHDAPGIIFGGIVDNEAYFINYDPDPDWITDTVWKLNIKSNKITRAFRSDKINNIKWSEKSNSFIIGKYIKNKIQISEVDFSGKERRILSENSVVDRFDYINGNLVGLYPQNYEYEYTGIEGDDESWDDHIDTVVKEKSPKNYLKGISAGNCSVISSANKMSLGVVCSGNLYIITSNIMGL